MMFSKRSLKLELKRNKLGLGLLLLLSSSLGACFGGGQNSLDDFVGGEAEEVGRTALQFAEPALNFGNSQLNPAFLESSIVLSNTSNRSVYIKSFTSNSNEFTVSTNSCPISPLAMDPGSDCSLTIRFSPQAGADRSAVLTTTYGLNKERDSAFTLLLGLSGRSTSEGLGNPGISITPSLTNFGRVPAFTTSPGQVVTLRNITSLPLFLGTSSVNNPRFVVTATSCPTGAVALQPNATCTLTVSFNPIADGVQNSNVSMNYGSSQADANTYTSSSQLIGDSSNGTTGNAALSFSPNYWDFGDVPVSSINDKVFVITNVSSAPVHIGDQLSSGPEFTILSTNCPLGSTALAASATCNLSVRFVSAATNAVFSNIDIKSGPAESQKNEFTSRFVVTGRSSPPPISSSSLGFSPNFWDFGEVAPLVSVNRSITITNTGVSPIYFGTFSRTSPSLFALGNTCPTGVTPLAPSETCTMSVTFTPLVDGNFSSTITVNYGASQASNETVSGTMVVLGRSTTNPIGNTALSLSPDFHDFGDIPLNLTSSRCIVVTNTGIQNIYFGNYVSNNGKFEVQNNACESPKPACPTGSSFLAPTGQCTIRTRYETSTSGIDTATVGIEYGFSTTQRDNLVKNLVLTGRSIAGETGNSAFTFAPSFYDFGDVAATQTVQTNITVTNATAGDLFVSNVTRTNASVFNVSHDCPSSPAALASAATCTITVGFTPNANGPQSSLVSLNYGTTSGFPNEFNARISVAGRSTAVNQGNPSIGFTPGYFDFGDVPRNTTQDQVITLTNTTTSPVFISLVDVSGNAAFTRVSTSCPSGATPLNASATCTATIRFAPTADVVTTGNLVVNYGPDQARSGNQTTRMTIAGRSIAAPPGLVVFGVNPGFYDYGDVAQGQSVPQVFTLTNNSGGNIFVSSITRSNTGAFTIANTCPLSPTPLANAATCTVTLGFSPNAEGAHNSRVDITHGFASASSTNLTQSFYAQGRSTAAANGNPALTYSPTFYDFGDRAANTNTDQVFTITNSSTANVYLGTASTNNSVFSVITNTCPSGATPLAASATCTVELRFRPTADGPQTGFLSYTYGPDQPRSGNLVSRVAIAGRSTASPIGNRSLTFAPTSWDFGDVAQGPTGATRAITVTNSLTTPLYIGSIAASPSVYTITDNCPDSPTPLAAGANCTLNVTFRPTADGGYSGEVLFKYGPDAARSLGIEQPFFVFGRSTTSPPGVAIVQFTPNFRDYGNVAAAANATLSFSVQNTSGSAIYLGSVSENGTDYSITSNNCPASPAVFAASATCTVSVRYTPSDEGVDINALSVFYGPDVERASNLFATATLIGRSEPAPISNASIVLSPNTWDFGNVALSPAFSDKTLIATNTSTRNLFIGSYTGLTGSFAVEPGATTCPASPTPLAAGASCNLAIRFSPLSGPQVSQTLSLNYGISSGNPTEFNSQVQVTGRSNPNPPTNFRFTAATATSATFAWDANTADQTSFEIERCTGASCESSFVSSGSQTGIAPAVRTHTWNALTEGELYRFRIRGVAGATTSTWLTGPMVLPFGGVVSVDNGTGLESSLATINCSTTSPGAYVGLYWNNIPNAAFYKIYRDNGDGSRDLIQVVNAPSDRYMVTGLAPETNLSFYVQAESSSGVVSLNTSASAVTTTRISPCLVVGQSSMTELSQRMHLSTTNIGNTAGPRNIHSDGTRLVVSDSSNSRVLIWNSLPTNAQTPPDVVLGQPSFDTSTRNFGAGVNIATSSSLDSPWGVFIHTDGKLIVADSQNNRVLVWNTIPTANNAPANVVIGQPNFSARGAYYNVGNCTATGGIGGNRGFNQPAGVFVDSGGKLYVVDRGAHRVMVWNSIPTSNGAAANMVIGQTAFTNCAVNGGAGVSARGFNSPHGIWGEGSSILVTDTGNHRVLRWATAPTVVGTNNADTVFGQANMTTSPANRGRALGAFTGAEFNSPIGIWGDGGSNIFVTDYSNNRVLRFPSAQWSVADPTADRVVGQTVMTANTAGSLSTQINGPISGWASGSTAGTRIFILQYGRPGITRYSNLISANGPAADFVLMQPRFGNVTTALATVLINSLVTSQRMAKPAGISIANNGRMVISDILHNRVLVYDRQPTSHLGAADRVLGQSNFTNNDPVGRWTVANDSTSAGLSAPAGVWTDGTRILVTDTVNNRILGWRTWPTGNNQAADFVIGQGSFTNSGASSNASTGLRRATGVHVVFPSVGNSQIFVADTDNNRVLYYTTQWLNGPSPPPDPPQTSMGASIVLGQAGFGTGTAAVTQAGMNGPRGIWASDSRVAVADTRNNRVLLYDRLGAGGEIANGRNADLVLGQPDFVSNLANNGGVNSQSLNTPTGVWSDGTRLFVVDAGNQRVLIWNSWPAIDQQPADRVVGQTNFLANSANQGSLLPNAYSLQHPFHALVHMGRLIVTDGAWIGNSGQFDTFQNSLPANVTTNSRVLFVPSW